MSRILVLALFFLAVFLQSGTYGLTFMLPKLFAEFGANEKDVGAMLAITTIITLLTVYYSGHFSDHLGRMRTLGMSGYAIMISLGLYSIAENVGLILIAASIFLGFGWGLMYTLGPVVLTRITNAENRVRLFSMFSVFLMAGFGLAPVFASFLEAFGYGVRDAFWIVALFCGISGSIFLFLRGPIAAIATTNAPDNKSSLSLAAVGIVLRSRGWLPIAMVFLGASVFAGLNNFQTVFAEAEGQDYADFFLAYTVTVVICRLLFASFNTTHSPYRIIAVLQYIMAASIVLFMMIDGSRMLYITSAILFGIGYGASYPVLSAMAANDAPDNLVPQTMQLFALIYFAAIFGFPFIAGWLIVDFSIPILLGLIAVLAAIEATMALSRHRSDLRSQS